MSVNNTYTSKNIQVLEGLEPVRKRPGMYIGSTGSRGLHHLIWEVLDNSIDEHLAGFCDKIILKMNKDGSVTVKDNGRGIPVDMHKNTRDYPKEKYPKGIVTERIILTVLHSGGKFDGQTYKVSGGLHGVGISVVNALSSYLKVEVFRDGNHYVDEYQNGGNPITKLKNGALVPVGKTKETGTTITFMPDGEIFETLEFKRDIIVKRLKEIAYLNKDLVIEFIDERGSEIEHITFQEKDGLIGFIKDINKSKTAIHDDIIYFEAEKDDIVTEVVIQFTEDFSETIFSFCNNINTQEGGTHVSGFKTAMTKTINKYIKELGVLKGKETNLDGKDIRNGLTAIVSIKHKDPQFEGQTKSKLGNSDARAVVEEVTSLKLELFFDRNIETLKLIIDNAVKSYNLRKVELKAKENFLNKTTQFSAGNKLASCQLSLNYKKGILTELFIVEGNSAGGSAKQGRDRKTQAILPLRGKILNTEKSNISKMLDNKEIISMVSAFGCGWEGIGQEFDINKLRYHKIIIMTDADVDGAHIRTLLLTFFFRHLPELIYEGKVYCAVPPLYKIKAKGKETYLYSDRELSDFIKTLKGSPYEVQRYKGLGEMNPEQLWETTMNPKTRVLHKVEIDDPIFADEITDILMGTKVPPRREFIEREAHRANIDI